MATHSRLLEGRVRVNPKKNQVSYVMHEIDDTDIFIPDKLGNPSLFGDSVIVELLPRNKWMICPNSIPDSIREKFDEADKKSRSFYYDLESVLSHDKDFLNNTLGKTLADILLDNLASNDDVDFAKLGDKNWHNVIMRTGRVISIKHQLNNRHVIGQIVESKSKKSILINPFDKRYPMVQVNNLASYQQDKIYSANIVSWQKGRFTPAGKITAKESIYDDSLVLETWIILTSCGLDFGQVTNLEFFTKSTLTCAEKSIGEFPLDHCDEIKFRKDYRDEIVFTIDPAGAKDLDDAIHIKQLVPSHGDAGCYELGVHIADASHYIRPGSELDCALHCRPSTIYLVHLAVPMLPNVLLEHLSLTQGNDKGAFSIIFTLDKDFNIVSHKFERSFINSKCQLSYEEAQFFIDHESDKWSQCRPKMDSSIPVERIAHNVRLLNRITKIWSEQRKEKGILRMNRVTPKFTLAGSKPIGVMLEKKIEANRLVEEIMLLSNETVAELLQKELPETAYLRRHLGPAISKIVNTSEKLKVDITNTKAVSDLLQDCSERCSLADSMQALSITNEEEDLFERNKAQNPDYIHALCEILIKVMKPAEYYCNGDMKSLNKRHYGINKDWYTHFTSPIRRYADIIVHRQVSLVLANRAASEQNYDLQKWWLKTSQKEDESPSALRIIAEKCNNHKTLTAEAQRACAELFYALFVQNTGQTKVRGIVVNIGVKYALIFMPESGLSKKLFFDDQRFESASFDKKKNLMTILWKSDEKCSCHTQRLTLFSSVHCSLSFQKVKKTFVSSYDRLLVRLVKPCCSHV